MLPHTALRTARPSWQHAAPVPVSEAGAACCRAPEGPWKAVGAAPGRRGSAGPAVRGSGGPQPRTRIRWAPAAYADPVGPAVCAVYGPRGAEGRAVEGARMHPQPPGAYGARTRGGYGPDMVEGASRRGAGGSRRRGRVRGSVTPVGPRARQIGGRGSFTSVGPGPRARQFSGVSRSWGGTEPRGLPDRPWAFPERSPALAGRAGAGRMCLWHARGRPLPVGSGRPRGASGSCALGGVPGADRPRRCCPGDYLPLAASLSFEPAETFTL